MKYDLRLQMVRYADAHGIKPAARHLGCQPKIVRKWLRRWLAHNRAPSALKDRSRAPKSCPHKTPARIERQVLKARREAPCLGPRRLKDFYGLSPGRGAIARIIRQAGLAQKRKKKYQKKRDMREQKARFAAFEEIQVDTKYLNDIPFYVQQMWRNQDLPGFQYSWRDVKTGGLFLGFGRELSEEHACCFVAAVAEHFERLEQPLRGFSTIQTDNGSEYSGAERCERLDRGFHYTVEHTYGAKHRFIPPGKKNHQADVETIHERVEAELFDLETFASREAFFRKTSAWQLWWNTTRKNGYKANRTPDEILREERQERDFRIWLLPAIDLDEAIRRKQGTRGYHVPALPVQPSLKG